MDSLLSGIKINVNQSLYLIEPTSSKLGQKIIVESVQLIETIGFEKFTFKKLGGKIDSPEASIYRYFKNKYQLLNYLVSMYWGWMEYALVIQTSNIPSAHTRLENAIALITTEIEDHFIIEGISINKLHHLVISESVKSYMTKEVEQANEEGAYLKYKQFVARITEIIKELNPNYIYPHMLLTTIIEGAHLQSYFAKHLPRLTDKQESADYIKDFYTHLALQTIKNN
jgi:AcrR family transcriptional regulator